MIFHDFKYEQPNVGGQKEKLSKKLHRYHFIFLIVIVLLFPIARSHITENFFTPRIYVTNEHELIEAARREWATIIVDETIHLSNYIPITRRIKIGGTGTITVSDSHRHFVVHQSGTLTLTDHVMLTRRDDYIGCGGGIRINGGMLTMHGGHIYNNHWKAAPESPCGSSGGGVNILDGGTVHIYSGMISHNTANRGGGVNLRDSSQLIMHGGSILHNHAKFGGGVHNSDRYAQTSFQMNGGVIGENAAQFVGGGIFFRGSSNANLYGGQISGNEAAAHGGIYARVMNVGVRMRIEDNYPANFYQTPHHHIIYAWIITPTVYRLLAVFVIAIIGTVVTSRKLRTSSGKSK